ncbi:MAG: hypothetical protein QXM35_08205 [Candidatus Methanomethylicia archaeon]
MVRVDDETYRKLLELKEKFGTIGNAIKQALNPGVIPPLDLTIPIPPAYRVDRKETEKFIPFTCMVERLHVFFHMGTETAIRDFVVYIGDKEVYRLKMSGDGFEDNYPINMIVAKGTPVWFEASNVSSTYTYHPIVELILKPIEVRL